MDKIFKKGDIVVFDGLYIKVSENNYQHPITFSGTVILNEDSESIFKKGHKSTQWQSNVFTAAINYYEETTVERDTEQLLLALDKLEKKLSYEKV